MRFSDPDLALLHLAHLSQESSSEFVIKIKPLRRDILHDDYFIESAGDQDTSVEDRSFVVAGTAMDVLFQRWCITEASPGSQNFVLSRTGWLRVERLRRQRLDDLKPRSPK